MDLNAYKIGFDCATEDYSGYHSLISSLYLEISGNSLNQAQSHWSMTHKGAEGIDGVWGWGWRKTPIDFGFCETPSWYLGPWLQVNVITGISPYQAQSHRSMDTIYFVFFVRGPQVDTRPMNITSPRYQWYTEAWIGIQYKGGERLDGHPVAILPPWLQVKNQVEIHPWVPFVNFTSFKECHF